MLQAAAITELLSRLIGDEGGETTVVRPHTALLTLLESSELYAVATRLVEQPPARSAVASILASTAAAAGTSAPSQLSYARAAPLTLDERAACLSALAVTSWRQATESSASSSKNGTGAADVVVMPGASVTVAKHDALRLGGASGKPSLARETVPLLLESDLGRVLVMPIVPSAPAISPSRTEHANDANDTHDDPPLVEHHKPYMLLTLNAAVEGPPASLPKSPATPGAMISPALSSAVASLSANNVARSRLRSGGTTPTSTRSEHTPTPSRSPVSDHFPASATTGPPGATGEVETLANPDGADEAAANEWEARQWAALYAQAKALARVLAPSLAQSGVAHHHAGDDHATEPRHSTLVSDDEADI